MNVERQCGECTLCCKLLPMRRDPEEQVERTAALMVAHGLIDLHSLQGMMPEFHKEAGDRCPHQSHHQGCKVYARRPFSCRIWNCRWLVNDDTAKLRRPDRSRYVIDLVPDFVTLRDNNTGEGTNIEVVQIWVDPDRRDAWRDPALLDYLERRGREGKASLIRFSASDAFAVFPPSMSGDGQWHEVESPCRVPTHTGAERIMGIASARKVRVTGWPHD